MKFMKLGSKPDTFQIDGNGVRYVASELAIDIVIIVGEIKFLLHKFPLQSKSNHLQKLIQKANEENTNEVSMPDFPAGPKAFEICAKFCYGMTVTLNAYNVVAARCAAGYLEMTEDVDRGNLISKTDVFLKSSIFHSWKDSIITLQTTKSLLPLSEDLKVVGRCVDSIVSKASVDPLIITWSYTYNRKAITGQIDESGVQSQQKIHLVPNDWWVEDVSELEINLYKRVIIGIKSKGRVPVNVIGQALKAYAVRWLPNSFDALSSNDYTRKYRVLVETIISLLPSNEGVCCSCSFLLKLLKVAILVRASDVSKEDLVKRIGLQLYEASTNDLLIPAQLPETTVYSVGLVQNIVNQFLMQHKHTQESDYIENNEKGSDNLAMGRGSWLVVAKLIDRYLVEIARDPKLPLSCFIDLAQSIPESARPIHDGLYKSIDVYLKGHPNLSKAERKKICGLIDVKKFTVEASMHAAQNERLPLRMIVQVIFFVQVRVAAGGLKQPQGIPNCNSCKTKIEEDRGTAICEDEKLIKKQMKHMKNSECRRTGERKKDEQPQEQRQQ